MKRRLVLIFLAVILALVGTGIVYSYVKKADNRALNGVKATSVLVATQAIPAGTPWSAVSAYVSTQSLPVSSVPGTALASTGASVPATQVTTFAVQPGQVLTREMFATSVATTGALAIPGTLQAVTITLPSAADVGGFVQNGSEVAVYSIVQYKGNDTTNQVGSDKFASKLILPRVSVLASSQSATSTVSGGGTNGSANGTVMVTLALSQNQAERVLLAQKLGDLYLGLLTSTSASIEDNGVIGIGIFAPTPLFTK